MNAPWNDVSPPEGINEVAPQVPETVPDSEPIQNNDSLENKGTQFAYDPNITDSDVLEYEKNIRLKRHFEKYKRNEELKKKLDDLVG